MWDSGGKGGEPGHSNEVVHSFQEWAAELRSLGPFPALEVISPAALKAIFKKLGKEKGPCNGWLDLQGAQGLADRAAQALSHT